MNAAAHRVEGNGNTPVLYMALDAHPKQPRRFHLRQATGLPTLVGLFEPHLPDFL